MSVITIEISDEDLILLDHICEEEACTWDVFMSVMIKAFIQLSPFHLETLESYID